MAEQRRTRNRYPHLAPHIREIIHAYAAYDTCDRHIAVCQPRAFEIIFYPGPGNPKWTGNNGKVCYPSEMNARAAADAINTLDGADKVVAYACPRGGHWHHVDAGRRARTTITITGVIAAAAKRAMTRQTPEPGGVGR
jgi:hypothetical protein